jgi:hypothetical protein
MHTKIHIVDYEGILKIIQSHELRDGCIKIRHYEGDDDYYDEPTPVTIKETFLVITKGEFIRDYNDTSKLNACTMSGGFGQINRLAYSYSVVVMNNPGRGKVWQSDLIHSSSGIRETRFDMYSYHFNEPEQRYDESRLDYEVFESLNLTKIFSKYLTKADMRDSKLEDLGI